MYTDHKALITVEPSVRDLHLAALQRHHDEVFQVYAPCQVKMHPSYQPLAAMALLIPPLGFLAFLLLSLRRNTLDRMLGRTLFWRSLVLPFVVLVFFRVITILVQLSPEGQAWMW